MRTREEIEQELEKNKNILGEYGDGCECGCDTNSMDYYRAIIKTLEWVLEGEHV